MAAAVLILLAGGAGVMFLSPKPPASPVAVARVAPSDGPSSRLLLSVADAAPGRLSADGVPRGWQLKEFTGKAVVDLVRSEGRAALRLRSERTSFALHRDVVVDLKTLPFLSWSWKVTQLPVAGDVRESGRDDQAAQVYVVFPRWPSPRTASEVIGYVWDSRAPAGTRLPHPRAANVRILVVESGRGKLDTWQSYQRNVAEDYAALFGRPAPQVGKVAVMIDSNDTRGEAEVLIGDLVFSRGPAGKAEIPSIVLR